MTPAKCGLSCTIGPRTLGLHSAVILAPRSNCSHTASTALKPETGKLLLRLLPAEVARKSRRNFRFRFRIRIRAMIQSVQVAHRNLSVVSPNIYIIYIVSMRSRHMCVELYPITTASRDETTKKKGARLINYLINIWSSRLSINWVKCCKLCECQDRGATELHPIAPVPPGAYLACVDSRYYVDNSGNSWEVEERNGTAGHWLARSVKRACTGKNVSI